MDDAYSGMDRHIFSGRTAVSTYLISSMPPQTSPVKTLQTLIEFGENLNDRIYPPSGTRISCEQVNAILDYLDSKFDFSTKVLYGCSPVFSLLDCCHAFYNSEMVLLQSSAASFLRFFLYHLKQDSIGEVTPEAVLFHELGHAIHAKVVNDLNSIPNEIIETIEGNGFSGIKTLAFEDQCEILADVLSVGMMFDSQFQSHNPFAMMEPCHQKAFQSLLSNLIG
jgi:hypothetical protein